MQSTFISRPCKLWLTSFRSSISSELSMYTIRSPGRALNSLVQFLEASSKRSSSQSPGPGTHFHTLLVTLSLHLSRSNKTQQAPTSNASTSSSINRNHSFRPSSLYCSRGSSQLYSNRSSPSDNHSSQKLSMVKHRQSQLQTCSTARLFSTCESNRNQTP